MKCPYCKRELPQPEQEWCKCKLPNLMIKDGEIATCYECELPLKPIHSNYKPPPEKKRVEIPEKFTWNLNRADMNDIRKYVGQLMLCANQLIDVLREMRGEK